MKSFEIEAVVEIPLGSMYKYEVDKKTGSLIVDRPLPEELPYNYGFIPGTLHGDGDPLDVCIVGNYSIHPLAKVKVIVLGAYICNDNGQSDDKLVAMVAGESQYEPDRKWQIEHEIKEYLSTYKPGFVVEKFVDADEAYRILMKDVDAYQNE